MRPVSVWDETIWVHVLAGGAPNVWRVIPTGGHLAGQEFEVECSEELLDEEIVRRLRAEHR